MLKNSPARVLWGYNSNLTWVFYVILYAFLLSNEINGQVNDALNLRFRHYPNKKGLSNNNVRDIQQDKFGFLWIATANGLNRFDGYQFISYYHQQGNPNSLPHDVVEALLVDKKGRIFVSTQGGLAIYRRETNDFACYYHSESDPHSLSSNYINRIIEDSTGNIWVLTMDRGFNLLVENSGTIKFINYYNNPTNNTISTDDNKVNRMVLIGNQVWFACDQHGFGHLSPTTPQGYTIDQPGNIIKYRNNSSYKNKTVGKSISAIFLDSKGWLWIGPRSEIIEYFDPRAKTFHPMHDTADISAENMFTINNFFEFTGNGHRRIYAGENYRVIEYILAGDQLVAENWYLQGTETRNFYKTKDNRIFLISRDGLYQIMPGATPYEKSTFSRQKAEKDNPYGLKTNNLEICYEDKTQCLWIGTPSNGLFVTDLKIKDFGYVNPEKYFPLSGGDGLTYKIYEDDNRNLFVSHTSLGVFVMKDPDQYKGAKAYTLPVDPAKKGYLGTKQVWNTFMMDGRFFIGSNSLDISADNSQTIIRNLEQGKAPKLNHFQFSHEDTNSLSGWMITTIKESPSGDIWIGTVTSGVSVLYDYAKHKDNVRFQRINARNSSKKGLIHSIVWDIGFDKKDNIWVGTQIGLSKLTPRTKVNSDFIDYRFAHYTWDESNLSGHFPKSAVKCIYFSDKTNTLWIGTEGAGLLRAVDYSPLKADSVYFVSYTDKDGLPNNTIWGILEDENQNLWLSTNKGLCRFKPPVKPFDKPVPSDIRVFTESDGLQDDQFNMISYHKGKSGRMYFGGVNGFNYFYPDSIRDNPFLPQIVLTNFSVFGKPVKVQTEYWGHILLEKDILLTKTIRLPYKANVIAVEFAALHYANPDKIKYEYRLHGFENEWVATPSSRRIASYTNLKPGQYTFQIRATNNDGIWSPNILSLEIIQLPPWWATWWFRSALFIFIIGSAIGFYRYRVSALKREKRILEARVAERTTELSEANAQLEERQEEILTQKEELETKNEQISRAYDNMQLLSDFGQRITATLNLEAINQMIYDYVSSLMDTQAFGIGIYNEKRKVIEFLHFVEDGQVLPYFTKDLASAKSLSVRCFVNKEEIVIGNLGEEYKRYLATLPEVQTKKMPVSMVHLPLVVEGRAIGTLTVNSFRTDAYGPNELNNLRSLASYISIALDNASVYKVLRHTNEKVQNSIEYARTIQQAILPLREEMDKHFQSFVLFRPKDVVSGDFYWMQVVDGAIYFAVVDCTGHGVPGAFMSLIGSRLLDEIVKEKAIRQPSQILETLDHELGIALRQGDTENNDGMDVCLVKLESGSTKEWTLTFSGAMRPLHIVQGGELKKLKGDRRSIGGKRTIRKTVIAFTDQSQVLDAGATLYLSSDGFADQNNGNHDKFGVIALEKLLTTMAPQPLDNQLNQLNNALDTHMGHEEQRDDVTMVGIRI